MFDINFCQSELNVYSIFDGKAFERDDKLDKRLCKILIFEFKEREIKNRRETEAKSVGEILDDLNFDSQYLVEKAISPTEGENSKRNLTNTSAHKQKFLPPKKQ